MHCGKLMSICPASMLSSRDMKRLQEENETLCRARDINLHILHANIFFSARLNILLSAMRNLLSLKFNKFS